MPNKPVKKLKSRKYFVNGMHCSSCEIIIRQDVQALEGVDNVEVSLAKSHLVVYSSSKSHFPEHEKLNFLFSDLGYTFHNTALQESRLSSSDVKKILALAVLFVLAFYFLDGSGFFMKFAVTSQSSLFSYFVFGLAAGISSCAALVGGLLLSFSKKWNLMYGNNSKQSIKPFILFNASRIIAFGLLGGLLGFVGGIFTMSMEVSSFLTIMISVLMIVLGLQMVGIKWFQRFSFNFLGNSKYLDKNSDLQGKYVPIIVGAMTFFIPCGFTLIAQSNVLNSGSFVLGASQLAAFSLGTLPMLALVSFTSVRFFSNPKFANQFSLFAGSMILFFALYTINSQLNVLGLSSLSDLKVKRDIKGSGTTAKADVTLDEQGRQVMVMEAAGFDYYPKDIFINSNTKTLWEIHNKGSSGCAAAVYGRGLYPGVIYLKPGVNSVEFTSPKPGTYKVSCSMGMVDPINVHVL